MRRLLLGERWAARWEGVRIRIVITTAGSRGDVQPCVALGLGLKRAGHLVTVATWTPFRDLIKGSGLSFYPVAGPDPDRLVAALVEAGGNPMQYAGRFRDLLCPHFTQGFHDCLAACRNADAIVYTPLGFTGYMAAEQLRVPAVGSVVQPLFVRTGYYPSAMLGSPPGSSPLVGTPGLAGYTTTSATSRLSSSTGRLCSPWWPICARQ